MTADQTGADAACPPTFDLYELEALLAFQMESGADWVLDETPHDRFAEAQQPGPRFAPAWAAGAAARRSADSARAGHGPDDGAAARSGSQEPASRDVPRRDDDDGRFAPAPGAPAGPQAARRASGEGPAPAANRAAAAGGMAGQAADLASAAEEIAVQAGALARAANSLDELQAAMQQFDGCALKRTARQLVFADGAPDARIMLVGEAPGAEEDRIGKPFVGRSGQLLDRMLAAIGLDRSSVFIANTVPWRPPGNRTPTPQESAICRPFIERQIELVNPDVLVCLGGPAAQALLGVREGVLRIRGRWQHYTVGERQIQAMATLHPAYLLRSPLQKRLAWRDLRAIKAALDAAASGG